VACAELVREEVNESASRLLLAMLEISRLHGHITNDGTPVRLSEADILERLISDSSQKNSSDVEVSLHECLTTLQNDPWKLLSAHLMDSAGNTQKRYSVDFSRILDMIRVKEVRCFCIYRVYADRRNLFGSVSSSWKLSFESGLEDRHAEFLGCCY